MAPRLIGVLLLGLCACTFDPRSPDPVSKPSGDAAVNDAELDADIPTDPPDAGTNDAEPVDAAASIGDAGPADAGDTLDAGPTPVDAGISIVPSNQIPPETLTEATGNIRINGVRYLDSDTGLVLDGAGNELRSAGTGVDAATNVGFRVVTQPNGPSIGVFSFATMTITPTGVLRAYGGNALALVASGNIDVAGLIDVRGGPSACGPMRDALPTCPGPGGGVGGTPCAPCCNACGTTVPTSCNACNPACSCQACAPAFMGDGWSGSTGDGICYGEAGGGGGAHATAGGAGGDGSSFGLYLGGNGVVTTGGAGGISYAATALTPLTGGGAGGAGALEAGVEMPGLGGGGGGGIQIVSATLVRFAGNGPCGINAGGGGGGASAVSEGGGGGGAGGGVLIEAPTVTLGADCVIAANGGGGSGGHGATAASAGQLSDESAEGTSAMDCEGGDGGGGASRDEPVAQDAPDGPFRCRGDDYSRGSGGGGGGLGLIHVNADDFTEAGLTSPVASRGVLVRM